MLFFVTKRNIVCHLHKIRWAQKGFWIENLIRFDKGVSKKDFENILYANEFSYSNYWGRFLRVFNKKVRPNYSKIFSYEVQYKIGLCIEEGYIKKHEGIDERLEVTEKGLKFINILYFPKMLLLNDYVKAIIISSITIVTSWIITNTVIDRISSFLINKI